VLDGGTLEYLQRFLQCVKYIILEIPSPLLSFIPPPLIAGTVPTGIIFTFTYRSMHYAPCGSIEQISQTEKSTSLYRHSY
jgi:hypothetical protein